MKVLGIDPGYGRCGVAVVQKNSSTARATGDREITLLYSDCIETPASAKFPERLTTVAKECARLIEEFAPDSLALEKLYFQKNQKTAMQVAEVRGALQERAAQMRIRVFEYTPGEVKAAVTGFGGADKKSVAKMLHALVKIEKTIRHDDEYDAIAIALTHLARLRPS